MKNESMLQTRIALMVCGEKTTLRREEIERMVEYCLFKRNKHLFEPSKFGFGPIMKPRKFLKPPSTKKEIELQDEITLMVDGVITTFPRYKIENMVGRCLTLRRKAKIEYMLERASEDALSQYLFKK